MFLCGKPDSKSESRAMHQGIAMFSRGNPDTKRETRAMHQ